MTRAVIRVATHEVATLAAIHAALDARTPIALIHARLPREEQDRQRVAVEAATLDDDDAVILFTSGSTGSARGVVLSRPAIEAAARAAWDHLGRVEGDRWPCTLPLAHAGGLSIVLRCRVAGLPGTLADERATLRSLVPAQLADLLADPAWRPPASLRVVLLGGAAAPPALIERALARGVPVHQTYGLTETFGQVATARTPGGPLVPLPGVELVAGTRAQPEPIRIRGPMLATRYLDGAAIAPELATHDLGFVEHGELHVLGRIDDVIISGGENVHPARVEAVVAATPGVRAAIAFGVADERWGQLVGCALEIDGTFSRTEALARWHAALPPFARPRRLAVVSELPRGPSGKLDRRAAAALASAPVDYQAAPHPGRDLP